MVRGERAQRNHSGWALRAYLRLIWHELEAPMETESSPIARPTLTATERRAILDEYDSYLRGDPRRGARLRRHGLSTSHIAKWRQRLATGEMSLAPKAPGPVPQLPNPLAAEVARLRRETARLQAELTKAETIIAIQKKVATLLGLPSTRAADATGALRE